MTLCPSCTSEVPEASRLCLVCGAPIQPSSVAPTRSAGIQAAPTLTSRGSSSDSLDQGGFTPGTMLAGRYRLVGLLGRGGMGEVYRADDLKLGQPVALKFLPELFAKDPARQARFLNEVRVARQVSHPNVCRVYDVGEAAGRHFLSMEFVDGEDLASLLRRIGRLPRDKAVEIARQLCAGLAAAHDKGVLHRDLKPANVMIDGRGKVRITDFGLAGVAGELGGEEARAGTPAYMSPEQTAGREVTVKSDLYALGLVLYETFTGKRPFDARTLPELARLHEEATPTSPSSHVEGLDPAVERAILRCLAKDPRERPPSALAVAAALPGGDPLAAALEAGETPSPEMVAAAGEAGSLRPAVAWACVASIVMGSLVFATLSPRTSLIRKVPLEKPPEALEEIARGMIRRLGYTDAPLDRASDFAEDDDYVRYVEQSDASLSRWDGLETGQPAAVYFWYRQSPRRLVARTITKSGRAELADPPQDVSGMASVLLDPKGRLIELDAVPPEVDESKGPWPDPDWAGLFSLADLDPPRFRPSVPTWVPPVYAEVRAAWEGEFPDRPHLRIRVEAAAYHGRPVFFKVIGPWSRAARMRTEWEGPFVAVSRVVGLVLLLALLVGGTILVRRNLRLDRGDRNGAFRLALYVFSLGMIAWLFTAGHVPAIGQEVEIFFLNAEGTLLFAGIAWSLYIALEPIVRRRWPHLIISWSRLLAGRFRDPLVGRDILFGCVIGAGCSLLDSLYHLAPGWFGLPLQAPHPVDPAMLLGVRSFARAILQVHLFNLGYALLLCFLLVLLRILVKREWIAAVALLVLTVSFEVSGVGNPYINLFFSALLSAVNVITLTRLGVLATAVSGFSLYLLVYYPVTLDFSAWYSPASLFGSITVLALAAYGFHTSLGGRPVFGGELLPEAE